MNTCNMYKKNITKRYSRCNGVIFLTSIYDDYTNMMFQINIPFSLEVTLSFPQLILLLNVIRELNEQLSRLLEKQRNISDGKEHPYLLMRNSNPSECTLAFEDSGIESIGQSSVASSAFQSTIKELLHHLFVYYYVRRVMFVIYIQLLRLLKFYYMSIV